MRMTVNEDQINQDVPFSVTLALHEPLVSSYASTCLWNCLRCHFVGDRGYVHDVCILWHECVSGVHPKDCSRMEC